MNIVLGKQQTKPHLKVTIGIFLVVTLFFAFRAEAQDRGAKWAKVTVDTQGVPY